MTVATERPDPVAQRDAFGERLFASLRGGLEVLAVELGVRLGRCQALRDSGPATSVELAARNGVDERYGTVLHPDTVRRWARKAGFRRCAELRIANDFWRFYRLDR